MEKSKVFFTDLRTVPGNDMLTKLEKLVRRAGIGNIDFEGKFTAIKIHFGEPGNLAYIRPNYAARIVDIIRSLGGKPFLTDANTLYSGGRSNAVDHLSAAMENGFNRIGAHADVIIADGLKGTEYREVPCGGKYCPSPKIGSAIADADIVISMNHFKGHEEAGFGGALKNLGMGSGSRAGKKDMHDACRPVVDAEKCVACGACHDICAHGAPNLTDAGVMSVDWDKCYGCGRCLDVCPVKAIEADNHDAALYLNYKIAEYAKAVVDGRPHFHISLVRDVSPYCDCHAENDIPIVPDVGMFASFDPVALDLACADAVNAQPVMPNSKLAKANRPDLDNLTGDFPHTAWRAQIEHAKKIGLGEDSYELVTI